MGPGVTGTEVPSTWSKEARLGFASPRARPALHQREWFAGIPMQIPGILLNHAPLPVADWIAWSTERLNLRRPDSLRSAAPAGGHGDRSWRRTSRPPPVDDGFVDGLKAGRITVVAAVEGFDGDDILLADGSRIQADSSSRRPATAAGSAARRPPGRARRAGHPARRRRRTSTRTLPGSTSRATAASCRASCADEVRRPLDRQGVHQRPLISPPCQFSTSQREIDTIGGSSRSSDAVISVISARVNQRASAISAWSTLISSVRAVP